MFRPTFSWSKNDGLGKTASASYNQDPYLFTSSPLDEDALEEMSKDSIVVNSQNGNSTTYSSNKNLNGNLQINRKLGTSGRNVTIAFNGGYSKSDSESLSANATHLWLMQTAAGLDSTYQTNRYNLTPTKNFD